MLLRVKVVVDIAFEAAVVEGILGVEFGAKKGFKKENELKSQVRSMLVTDVLDETFIRRW